MWTALLAAGGGEYPISAFLLLMCCSLILCLISLLTVVLGTITKITRSSHVLRNSLYMSFPAKSNFLISFVFICYFKLADNYFTILRWFLPCIIWIGLRCTYVPFLWNLPPPLSSPSHPSRLSQSTGYRFPVSHSKLPLAIYFTHGNVHGLMLSSHIILPSPSPTVSIMSVSPFLMRLS